VTTKTETGSYLTMLSHRLFGRITPRFVAFEQIYQKSGISRLYESYMAVMLFASLAVFVSAFGIGAALHYFLFNLTLLQYFVAVLVFSFSVSLAVPMMFILYPLYRRSQRRNEIDANLVYTTGYMGVLSAGGISIEKIYERVAQVEQHAPIKHLAKRLIANVKIFGLDVASSLADIARRSPSDDLSKLLVGITNTIKTSGDLKNLLTFESKRFLHIKREQLKKTLGTLTILGEMYITAMLMGPILFIVMLTILSIMGNITFGLSPAEQLNLLVFFGLPAISTVFIVILNSVLPEEE